MATTSPWWIGHAVSRFVAATTVSPENASRTAAPNILLPFASCVFVCGRISSSIVDKHAVEHARVQTSGGCCGPGGGTRRRRRRQRRAAAAAAAASAITAVCVGITANYRRAANSLGSNGQS